VAAEEPAEAAVEVGPEPVAGVGWVSARVVEAAVGSAVASAVSAVASAASASAWGGLLEPEAAQPDEPARTRLPLLHAHAPERSASASRPSAMSSLAERWAPGPGAGSSAS
jgi:hypothetical protein